MLFRVGYVGYNCGNSAWKGSFYPQKLPPKEMLSFYAQRFSTVEINNTFYRMPKESDLESWAAQVPDSFRFVLKAPQTITHRKRLQNAEKETEELLRTECGLLPIAKSFWVSDVLLSRYPCARFLNGGGEVPRGTRRSDW